MDENFHLDGKKSPSKIKESFLPDEIFFWSGSFFCVSHVKFKISSIYNILMCYNILIVGPAIKFNCLCIDVFGEIIACFNRKCFAFRKTDCCFFQRNISILNWKTIPGFSRSNKRIYKLREIFLFNNFFWGWQSLKILKCKQQNELFLLNFMW